VPGNAAVLLSQAFEVGEISELRLEISLTPAFLEPIR